MVISRIEIDAGVIRVIIKYQVMFVQSLPQRNLLFIYVQTLMIMVRNRIRLSPEARQDQLVQVLMFCSHKEYQIWWKTIISV